VTADRAAISGKKQSVTVRRRGQNRLGANNAGRTRPVLDDENLAHTFAEVLNDQTGGDISDTTWSVRHNDADGLFRILRLCVGRTHASKQRENQRAREPKFVRELSQRMGHGLSSCSSFSRREPDFLSNKLAHLSH